MILPVRGRIGLLAAVIFLLAGIFAAPRFPPLYLPFSFVCHQIASRSFALQGAPLAVCSRCLGFYLGLAAALVLPVRIPSMWLWLLAAMNVADALLHLAGNGVRFTLSFLLVWPGLSACLLLAYREHRAAN